MSNYNLLLTLGVGSITAFLLFFMFYRLLRWHGKMAALATAASMLLLYVPLAVTHWAGLDVFAIHFAFFMMIPYGLGIITGVHKERRLREGKDELEKGMHWIPGLIIVFFILLAVVDSVIILFATKGVDGPIAKLVLPDSISGDSGEGRKSQFTGTIAHDFQDEEEQYDAYVEKLKIQQERGWQIRDGWIDKPVAGKDALFRIHVVDKQGEPVSGAKVHIDFLRPSNMQLDQKHDLKEGEPGYYQDTVNFSEPGCWQLKMMIVRGEDEHEVLGNTEVAEFVDGKVVSRGCVDGEPDMDMGR